MKINLKAAVLVAVVVSLVFFAGCANNASKPIPPPQILAIACPPVQAAIVQFEALDATLPNVPAAVKAEAALKQIQPTVTAACAAGATVSVANVQAFAQSVLPALGQIAGSLPLPPDKLAQVQAGLVAAEIAIGTVGLVQQQIKATQATAASASTSAPAK